MASLSARRAWIEISGSTKPKARRASLSARRAWIEIINGCNPDIEGKVALRKESVDRNESTLINCNSNFVALRKESVDRNPPT